MQIIDNLLILTLIVSSFIAGMKLERFYNREAQRNIKEALEKQFLRLRAKADADDPCKPYGTPQIFQPIPIQYNTGDFDGDGPINQQFMDNLKATGHAKTSFRKSDIAK